METPVYLDNQATTKIDPRVLDAMMPYLGNHFGNPSSNHVFGWVAREAVDQARQQVADIIGADPSEIIFTSGATESNNLALKGIAYASGSSIRHIISAASEHKAILDPLKALEKDGFDITVLNVDKHGLLHPDQLRNAIRDNTILVTLMTANNEIGVIQPVSELAAVCHEKGVLFHTDAAQAVGKIPFNVKQAGVDLASFTAHKIYGPKGIGALYIRRGRPKINIKPKQDGGGHESGLRSGTLNVAGIVGFGKACQLARVEMQEEAPRISALRDRLCDGLVSQLSDIQVNGHPTERLPGNLNISFNGIEGESLLMGLNDVAVSSSSACTSELREPSHVLKAIGLSDEAAYSAIRFGVGRFNTQEEIDWVAGRIVEVVNTLRALATTASVNP